MQPERTSSRLAAAMQQRSVPNRLTPRTRSTVAMSYSRSRAITPAQLTRTSSEDKPAKSRETSCGELTSHSTARTVSPTRPAATSGGSPAATTDAPRAAKRLATAAPIPDRPPVTSAVFCSKAPGRRSVKAGLPSPTPQAWRDQGAGVCSSLPCLPSADRRQEEKSASMSSRQTAASISPLL
jgi:hypothetical protein